MFQFDRRLSEVRKYWNTVFNPTPYYTTTRYVTKSPGPQYYRPSTTTTTTTTTTTKRPSSPHAKLQHMIFKTAGQCGVRTSPYLAHLPRRGGRRLGRRGRIVWNESDTMGSAAAPGGTFPWMSSLFVLLRTGEALFMCAGTILTPNIIVTAAHCFTNNKREETWFARVGDNYILKEDPNEQTFRVKKIIQHEKFDPLRSGGGDGKHDIALVILQPLRENKLIKFSNNVRPACVPQPDYPLSKLYENHCEIAGWGMTEYNNTESYPDSIRAARIQVGDVPDNYCDYLYKRKVKPTGKFCAGGDVDACQEDSGGPLVCRMEDGTYNIIGIVSSGKGCGVYPGLYTEVSRYIDWLAYWVERETVGLE